MENVSGFLLIDKPLEWTSHDVVAKVRGLTGIQRIGHGGTLDPLATGLLILGVGAATKQLEQFVQGDKSYTATVRLGATSSTDDGEGELMEQPDATPATEPEVRAALAYFQGKQEQLPPSYSALKTNGKKAYELARQGLKVPRQPRVVVYHEMTLRKYEWPIIELTATVSKGTYIRSLARDIGARLGTGGYLNALRRDSIGKLQLAEAVTMEQLAEDWQKHLRC